MAGRASPGDVTYVLTSYYIIHAYLRDVGMHINNLQRSVNDMEELVDIYDEPFGIADAVDARPIEIRGGHIVFEDVTFHYGGYPTPLYDGLSVDIRAGERVGLVGRSGSGKTTFVKLVQRLYDVSGGRILIDGQDIAKATQLSLRSRIAIVQQDPVLFHRSLADNIAYGRPGSSMAAIEQAARLANAHDFITRLPKAYNTLVGERGVKLSGGERQRVALARAFLADAPVLILDEATSSLDSESEALIQQAMDRLMTGRTSIVIAHRLSTVCSLDRILVFDRGEIVEEGNHAALIARAGGIYRALASGDGVRLRLGGRITTMNAAHLLVAFSDDVSGEPRAPIDVIFPVLHGPFGEDGSVQGLAHWSMCLRPSPQDRGAGLLPIGSAGPGELTCSAYESHRRLVESFSVHRLHSRERDDLAD